MVEDLQAGFIGKRFEQLGARMLRKRSRGHGSRLAARRAGRKSPTVPDGDKSPTETVARELKCHDPRE
jgi:hypothetical protein